MFLKYSYVQMYLKHFFYICRYVIKMMYVNTKLKDEMSAVYNLFMILNISLKC